MHFLNVLASLLAARGVLGFCRAGGVFRGFLSFCLPLTFFSMCEAFAGRPEPAVLLWFGLGLIAVQKAPGFSPFLLPCLAGLVFLSSPAVGVLAFVLLVVVRLTQRTAIRVQELVQGLAGILVAVGICFTVYPYPAVDWVMGVWRHSRINLSLPQGQGFFSTWIARAQTPLLLLTFTIPCFHKIIPCS